MSLKMKSHHTVAVRLNERLAVKRASRYIHLTKRRIDTSLFLWIVFVAFFSFGIYKYFDDGDLLTRKEGLVSMCDQRARMLQDQFNVSVNHVHALAILVSTFHYYKNPSVIDQETFAQYTGRTAFERPLLSGVAYAQRVLHSEREHFEKVQGWMIQTMERDPSPPRDEYAPVIFSQQTVSYIKSLDMMSGEEDRENILRARATGKAVLTSPFRLLESHHLGVVLTFPVYSFILPADATVEERIQSTAGYLGGAFDVESLVENLLGQLAGNEEIVVNVYDVTNSSEPLIMYGSPYPDGDMSLSHISVLDFGDPFRKHQMRCSRYLQSPPKPWITISTPIGVFVISLLVGYIGYGAGMHIVKIEEDFRVMQELKVRAEAADVAKSQFLATVSHEIRTPMNGVLGMLSMLLDTNLNKTQLDYAQTAQACGKALITLINEVLDRAKIEAGKLELEAVPFDLRSILDDVLSLFSGKSRDKGIELAVFVSDKVPQILLGDPGRFRQILTNLVGNSVKFTERGHIFVQVHLVEPIKLMVDAEAELCLNSRSDGVEVISGCSRFSTLSGYEAADDRNSWENFKLLIANNEFNSDVSHKWMNGDETPENVTLMISVEDTGIGIPLRAQDRVFTPFMQADSSTSRNYGGTGIGLSISKCLVELMGGQISFISRPQIGSTFTFTAALRRCDKQSLGDFKRPLSEALPTAFKGMKAVVVDGKPVRGVVTKYHLQRLGIVVELATSIKVALGMISGQSGYSRSGNGKQPDMILVEKDSWISYEEGQLSERLLDWKQNGRTIELTKMILIATYINPEESAKTKAAGFADTVIMKPLRSCMVAACLQQVFGVGNKRRPGKALPNGSSSLHSILNGRNILVVDDNKVNRRVAAGALKKFGANVECAESGRAALALLELPHTFDACFMDIQMPEMDGFEVTRLIRQMESITNEKMKNGESSAMSEFHMPILAMTADVIQATYEECLKCGMDGYVSKPFEEENLYKAVAKFFETKPILDS
ncbi:Signal transduction response regulator [Macleaya cordata]|uniref:histidine kinase n=1 Tax=Macleaya cordata TaxID=56857 RepID=A0A200Q6V4_MACCD|nr:Signal transduction response regulator [Macleaya cordata]